MVRNVSFTGNPTQTVLQNSSSVRHMLLNEMKKDIKNLMPRPIKLIDKMSTFVGEVPNIIINAIGTGLVAPVFIKYNPLSKTDEETRTYSAWRQPLSAILSVATQVSLAAPIEKLIDHMSNSGEFGEKYNKSAVQETKYFEKLIKKTNPHMNKAEIKALAKEKQVEQLASLIDSIKTNNAIEYIKDGKKIRVGEETYKGLLNKTVDGLIKDIKENLDRYGSEKPQKQIQRAEFIRVNKAQTEEALNKILTKVEGETNYNNLRKEIKTIINEYKKSGADKELIDILSEIRNKPDVITLKSQAKRGLSKCIDFGKCADKAAVEALINKRIAADVARSTKEINILKSIKNDIANNVHISKLAKKAKKITSCDFIYDVVQKYSDNIGKNIKGMKQVTGLITTLAILPVSCILLNELYPKMMDILFPSMSAKKHDKAKDQFIAHAKKTSEVSK